MWLDYTNNYLKRNSNSIQRKDICGKEEDWCTIRGIQSVAYNPWHTRFFLVKNGRILSSTLVGRNDRLIVISKEEALEIRKRIPSVHIHRTAKQKSKRHNYFVEESYKVLALIQKLRKSED